MSALPMRIAMPIWEGKISPVLDTASRLLVVEYDDRGEIARFEVYLEGDAPPGKWLRLHGMGIRTLICGAVSQSLLRTIDASGITVIPEIAGRAEEVIEAYARGRLNHSRFLMPGCRRRRARGESEIRRGCYRHRAGKGERDPRIQTES